jgi:ribokinase
MTNPKGVASPDTLLSLTHTLEKLRARDGLTHSRLDKSRSIEAAPLIHLPAVQSYAAVHHIELAEAAVAVIKACVRERLDDSAGIVADAVLGLGIFSAAYQRSGIEKRVVEALCSDLLGRRRNNLLQNWGKLHKALGLSPDQAPSDRTLRGTTEPAVFRELAHQLIIRDEYWFVSSDIAMQSEAEDHSQETSERARIIVVGGAVMDAIFRTKEIPQIGTSKVAYGFNLAPGGKGLMQAVAAARLGLDVGLVAAVANDRYGQEIISYLQNERVDTSLLKLINNAHCPVTGVVELELGDSIAINWPNQMKVRLDTPDVERFGQHFGACDAVLITFEIPRETLQYILALVNRLDEPRPIVILTPGQPYESRISRQALSQIDYLVAHAWELGIYAPPDLEPFDVEITARRLLEYGVKTVCLPTGGGCNIYSESLGEFNVSTFQSTYKESSLARDAFCAALAAKLIDSSRDFSEEVARWATTAMAAAIADYPLPNPMPDRRRIEQLLERSRSNVSPRVSDAVEAYHDQEQTL